MRHLLLLLVALCCACEVPRDQYRYRALFSSTEADDDFNLTSAGDLDQALGTSVQITAPFRAGGREADRVVGVVGLDWNSVNGIGEVEADRFAFSLGAEGRTGGERAFLFAQLGVMLNYLRISIPGDSEEDLAIGPFAAFGASVRMSDFVNAILIVRPFEPSPAPEDLRIETSSVMVGFGFAL